MVCDALHGAGVESVQAKWDEMFAPAEPSATGEAKPKHKAQRPAGEKKTAKKSGGSAAKTPTEKVVKKTGQQAGKNSKPSSK